PSCTTSRGSSFAPGSKGRAPIIATIVMSELTSSAGIRAIRAAEWEPFAGDLKHVFLAGDLRRAVPHPFLRRTDAEVILCVYQPGDDGVPHWHTTVDEIEV